MLNGALWVAAWDLHKVYCSINVLLFRLFKRASELMFAFTCV